MDGGTSKCSSGRGVVSGTPSALPNSVGNEAVGHSARTASSRRYLIVAMFVIVALVTRLTPLAISPYPFNNDGITECRVAQDIMESGMLSYPDGAYYVDSHTTITPAYDVLLASVSLMLGTSPFWVAQFLIAVFSVVTIVGIYTVVLRTTSNVSAAMASGFMLSFFGSFVYLTGSTWKESLGVTLLMLMVYAYIRRSDFRMFLLGIAVLLTLPVVHHLVAAVVYLALWYLTALSILFALRVVGSLKRRHLRDLAGMSVCTAVSYSYYHVNSLDRLAYFDGLTEVVIAGGVLAVVLLMGYWYLNKKSRFRFSFAPLPAMLVVVLFLIDYSNPIFGYEQATPPYVLILAVIMAILVGVGWYGMEIMVESRSLYRAIPLGLLFPVLLVFSLAIFVESGLTSHWLTYRTFDFVDISLAIGLGAGIASMASKPKRRAVLTVVLIIVLTASYPFGYATNMLTGVRHDTQSYEVDAITWVYGSYDANAPLQSDERLSYNALALYDFVKDPYLPRLLSRGEDLGSGSVNMLLDEWFTIGVNDYPEGRVLLDREAVLEIISQSDVLYVGGPIDNHVTVFES